MALNPCQSVSAVKIPPPIRTSRSAPPPLPGQSRNNAYALSGAIAFILKDAIVILDDGQVATNALPSKYLWRQAVEGTLALLVIEVRMLASLALRILCDQFLFSNGSPQLYNDMARVRPTT